MPPKRFNKNYTKIKTTSKKSEAEEAEEAEEALEAATAAALSKLFENSDEEEEILDPEVLGTIYESLNKTKSNDSFKSALDSLDSYDSYDSVPQNFDDEDLIETINCSEMSNYHILDLNMITMSTKKVGELGVVLTSSDNINIIPGLIKYGDIELPVIEYISGGTYGNVFKYSDITPLPNNYITNKDITGTTYLRKIDMFDYDEPIKNRPRKPEDKVHAVAIKSFIKNGKHYKLNKSFLHNRAKLFNTNSLEIGSIVIIDDNKYTKVTRIDKDDFYITDIDREIYLIERLNMENNRELCNTVNAKILNLNNNITNSYVICAVMEIMDGTLYHIKLESIEKIFAVLKGIARLLNCLIENNLSYSDLKTRNILYKCYPENKMKIVLGDLGSIFVLNEEAFSPCTYPPCDLVDEKTKFNTESAMVWQLGVVFIQLLKDDFYRNFSHDKIKSYIPRISEILNLVIEENLLSNYKVRLNDDSETGDINLGILLTLMMTEKSENRISIKKIISAELL